MTDNRGERIFRSREPDGWARNDKEWGQFQNKIEDRPVNIEKVTLSWSLLKIIAGIFSGACAVVYVTITINTFFYQAETFRATVTAQITQLNDSIRLLGEKLDSMARSPDIVRVRDLAEFCYELEAENRDNFRCPAGYRVQPKTKPAVDTWKAQ